MEQHDTSQEHIQFSVSLQVDRDGFLRRSCPSCGRDFKTEVDEAELQWELVSHCRRIGAEIGAVESKERVTDRLRCPYCGHEDASSEMHTEDTLTYLKRLTLREYVVPQMNKLFSGMQDSFGRGGHSGGLISVSWEFKHTRETLPPRPMHGPEPADFKIIQFLCCGKKGKIAEGWTQVDNCPYCSTAVRLT